MATIVLRRDTAARWAAANPILRAGEAGVDLTSGKMKLGDGLTAWVSLPFYGGEFSDWADIQNKPATFPPDAHSHDDTYSSIDHNHDGLYDLVGTADYAVLYHESGVDPHPIYTTEEEILPGVTTLTAMNSLSSAMSYLWSAGVISGCAITDNGNGTVNVAAGEALLRESAGRTPQIHALVVPATDSLSLTDGQVNYIIIDYNAGAPVITATTDSTAFNCQNICHLYRIAREGTDLHIVDSRQQNVDFNRSARVRMHKVELYAPSAGSTPIVASGMALQVGAGEFWYAYNPISTPAFDTTIAGVANVNVFRKYHYNGAAWVKADSQKTLVSEYNNAGTLTALPTNRYGIAWVYMIVASEAHLAVVVDSLNTSSLSVAETTLAPTTLPPALSGTGVLIGRCIVRQGAITPLVESAFVKQFAGSGATDHGSLVGLTDDDHGQYVLSTNGSTRAEVDLGLSQTTDDVLGWNGTKLTLRTPPSGGAPLWEVISDTSFNVGVTVIDIPLDFATYQRIRITTVLTIQNIGVVGLRYGYSGIIETGAVYNYSYAYNNNSVSVGTSILTTNQPSSEGEQVGKDNWVMDCILDKAKRSWDVGVNDWAYSCDVDGRVKSCIRNGTEQFQTHYFRGSMLKQYAHPDTLRLFGTSGAGFHNGRIIVEGLR